MQKDFNKKEEDFSSLADYNAYLEMVEDIIYNLSNNVDVVGTNKRIAEYKEVNRDFINKNRHRISREAQEIQVSRRLSAPWCRKWHYICTIS